MTTIATTAMPVQASSGKPLRIGLWVAQVLLAVAFIFIGFTKLATPIPELAAMMKWPGEYSPFFVRFVGAIDLLGGLGILLPSLTRIRPGQAVLAALGCTVLQVLAIGFHLMRGEASVLPLNLALISLSLFVLWGRGRRAPIAPRA